MTSTYWYIKEGEWEFAHVGGNDLPGGKICDFAIWHTPLTQQEIEALANGTRPVQFKKKLKEYYPLDALDERA